MSGAGAPWDDYATPAATPAPSSDGPWADYGGSSSAAPSQPSKGGFWRNMAAGVEEFPGAVANLIGSGNPGGFPYSDKPTDRDPAADITHAVGKTTGLQPSDVAENTFMDKTGRVLGGMLPALAIPGGEAPDLAEGVASSIPKLTEELTAAGGKGAPMRLANAPIATVARKVGTGLGAAAGSTAAGAVVPDEDPILKQSMGVLGAIAGGALTEAPSLAKAAATPLKRFAKPLTQGGQEQMAADTIRGRATDPAGLDTSLSPTNAEIVHGSYPTTFQQTGDRGLGGLEREQAAKNPVAFNQRRADQNQARIDALGGVQSGGNPDDVGTFLRGQFRDFDDQTQQHIDSLTAGAQQQAEALGGAGTPEVHGAAIRDALQKAETTARAKERSLWQSVDPDRNLMVGTQPTIDAAGEITNGMSSSAKPMEGEEKDIFGLVSGYKPDMPLADLSDLRSRTSAAMRQELMTNGATLAYARLTRLRGAIQQNLASAAADQATQDAEDVSRGTIAPQQTLAGKLQGWANDFYTNRTAQARTGIEGDMGQTADVGSTSNARFDGAGLSPEGGSGSIARDQSVPPQPFDQAAADRLASATQATKDRAGTFNQGPAKQVLAKAGTQDAYRLPEARVPEKYFHAGPTSFQDIQGLRQTVGDEAALPILQDYAASSLRKAAETADGTLDQRKVAAWQTRYGNALRAFPELNARFSTAADASNAIAESAAARSEAIADRNSSALGKVMNAQTGDDVTKTVGNILGGKNSTQAMQDLVQAASRSPEATAGLRQAVADHITKNFVSNTEAGTSGTNLIKSDAYQSFLKKNRPALGQVFSPEEMDTLDRIGADLKRANRSVAAVKLPGGSNTAQDLHGMAANDPNATVLDRALNEAAAAGAGMAVGHAAGAGLGWMGAKVANAFRAAGLQKVDDLVTQAMLNPDLAKQLLRHAPAQSDSGQSAALASRLRRIGMTTLATRLGRSGNQSHPYKRGGRVHEEASKADHDPSDAQIEAGNYQKGHVKLLGFDISIETPQGAPRRGTGEDGKEWENRHETAHYGYLKRTEGADEEHVDAYIGPHPDSKRIFVVNQFDPATKKFDEHKLVFGARGPREARSIYDGGFSDGSGPKRRWAVHEVDPRDLRVWLAAGKRARPFPKVAALA